MTLIKCKYLGEKMNNVCCVNITNPGKDILKNDIFLIPESDLINSLSNQCNIINNKTVQVLQTSEEIAKKANYISITAGIVSLVSLIIAILTYLNK